MTNLTEVVPASEPVETGVRDVVPVACGLSEALADTYRLVFKTHACHWNVQGPLFYPIHQLTEAQYTEMFAAADVIAERIRALGQLAPARLCDVIKASAIEDPNKQPSAQAMIEDLAADHAKVAARLHALITLADAHDDPVSADLMTARAAFHETAAWMLRATAK
ncbi:MAG: DNA starvation/stationary phase protection protein [Paracoccaceae bacterium]|nr:DNA starvation/stationary phase protection protein [Paracoccaceae bacterium]